MIQLLAGTAKGLLVYEKGPQGWIVQTIHFSGCPVSMVYQDVRDNTWWVGLSHRHWGEKLHYSKDQGKSWKEVSEPSYSGYFYKGDKAATLKRTWVMEQAGHDKPGCLWLGTEPGGLFYSEDGGETFHLVESLWNHPSRANENQWFGAGKDFPFIHSIVVDPRDSNHLYIAVSCAGVFESLDGGTTWQPKNNGLVATYLPNPQVEIGHDPHRLLQCRKHPDVLWQQNHCGIFRTTNGGETWKDVSSKDGYPYYGFCLAIDTENPDQAWVIPAESDLMRIPLHHEFKVFHTPDGGLSWNATGKGLPPPPSFDLVLRHGFAKMENLLAFGTNNGNLYVSEDNGLHFFSLSHHLATVNHVAWVFPLK